jgi:methylated-DNA-protein-cysteine methyltransferase-like protein
MPEAKQHGGRLYALVRRIPKGRVVSYGLLGSFLTPPLSGRVVGRLMAFCPDDAAWWRVVAKSGSLPIHKRSPIGAAEQERRLTEEGVTMHGGRVDMTRHACTVDELSAIL